MTEDINRKTILIVEDEPDVSNITSKILLKAGYNVIAEASAENAIESAINNKDINLILMDIDLGGSIDGAEAARRILDKIDIPVVFHTSYSGEEISEKVRGIVRYGHIIKSSGNFVLLSSLEMAFGLFNAHKKVEKSENLFRGLFENSLNAIALVELIYTEEGAIKDGKIIALNPAFEKCVGLRAADVIGKLYTEVYPEVLKTDKISKLDDVLRRNEVYHAEAVYEPLNKFFNFTAHEIDKGLVAIIMEDITEQIASRQTLIDNEVMRQSFSLLHRITDSIPASVAYVDARSLRYEFVNTVFAANFGISPEKIIGMEVCEVLGETAYKNAFPYIERARNGERVTYENMIPAHGDLRCFNIDYIPQADDDGNVKYLIVLAIDITQRKLSENRISRLLSEKEILIREVHHRIKNNMSTIAGILFMQSDSMQDASAIAALSDAESRIHSMMVLYDKLYRTDNVREMSVMEYIPPLINEIICCFPMGKKVQVEKRLDNFIINSNYLFPLGIILNEIITNTMKYAFKDSDGGIIIISANVKNNCAVITVEDNGSGLPDGIDIKQSSGFGLHLVGMLVDQIHGNIKIERQNGTRFILEFML